MHQVASLNWKETAQPRRYPGVKGRLVLRVRRIRIEPSGWSVDASVTNSTGAALRLVYEHNPPGLPGFGVILTSSGEVSELASLIRRHALPPPSIATRYRPAIPALLRPGENWSGTFSGPDLLAAGRFVHVEFGDFGTPHGDRFGWVTNHAYRVREG